MDKTDKVIEKLDKMEKTLNYLAINEKESVSEAKKPLALMKNDWEPFIKIEIDHQNFLAYCDLGSTVSIMPKMVYDSLIRI